MMMIPIQATKSEPGRHDGRTRLETFGRDGGRQFLDVDQRSARVDRLRQIHKIVCLSTDESIVVLVPVTQTSPRSRELDSEAFDRVAVNAGVAEHRSIRVPELD